MALVDETKSKHVANEFFKVKRNSSIMMSVFVLVNQVHEISRDIGQLQFLSINNDQVGLWHKLCGIQSYSCPIKRTSAKITLRS